MLTIGGGCEKIQFPHTVTSSCKSGWVLITIIPQSNALNNLCGDGKSQPSIRFFCCARFLLTFHHGCRHRALLALSNRLLYLWQISPWHVFFCSRQANASCFIKTTCKWVKIREWAACQHITTRYQGKQIKYLWRWLKKWKMKVFIVDFIGIWL